jgi:hypothetical protein
VKIQFDKEDGRKIETDASAPAHLTHSAFPPSFESAAAKARVESLVLGALSGTLPRERALEPYEAQKLRPRHIAILMQIAAGMTVPEASEKYRMTTVRINTILKHPDSIKIMAALQSQAADKMSDVNARLQQYANEMLTTQVELVRTTKNEGLKSKIAADLLDRAGYGPRQKIDINATNRYILPAAAAAGLTTALNESDRIAEIDYRQFTAKNLSHEAKSLESGAGESARPIEVAEPHDFEAVSASPAASPETNNARRIA